MRWFAAALVGAFLLSGNAWAADEPCRTPKYVHDYMYDEANPPIPVATKILTSEQIANLAANGPGGAPAYLTDHKSHVIAEAYAFKSGFVFVVFYLDGCVKNTLKASADNFIQWISPAGSGA